MTDAWAPNISQWNAAIAEAVGDVGVPGSMDPMMLKPGDVFIHPATNRALPVTGWPEHLPTMRIVTVPVERPALPVESFVAELAEQRKVIAWQRRRVNYGTTLCDGCGTNVGRDHEAGSEVCRLAGEERDAQQREVTR